MAFDEFGPGAEAVAEADGVIEDGREADRGDGTSVPGRQTCQLGDEPSARDLLVQRTR